MIYVLVAVPAIAMFSFRASALLLACLVLADLYWKARNKVKIRLSGRWVVALLGLVAFGLVSGLVSISPMETVSRIAKFAGFVFCLGSLFSDGPSLLRQSYAAVSPDRSLALAASASLILSIFVVAGHAITEGALLGAVGLADYADPELVRAATNPGSTVLAVFCPILLVMIGRQFGLLAGLFGYILVAICLIFFTASQAALVGLIAGTVAAALVVLFERKAVLAVGWSAASTVLCLPVMRFFHDTPLASFRDFLAQNGIDVPRATLHRTYIYDYVIARIAENPLLGWGLGTSRFLPGGRDAIPDPRLSGSEYLPLHPHNSILEIWVETGFVGATVVALLTLWGSFWLSRQAIDKVELAALMFAVSAYLGVGFFAYSAWSSWWIATGILFIVTCAFLIRQGSASKS